MEEISSESIENLQKKYETRMKSMCKSGKRYVKSMKNDFISIKNKRRKLVLKHDAEMYVNKVYEKYLV